MTGTEKEATEVNEYANIKVPSLPFVRYRYFRHVGPCHIYTETAIVLISLMTSKIVHIRLTK